MLKVDSNLDFRGSKICVNHLLWSCFFLNELFSKLDSSFFVWMLGETSNHKTIKRTNFLSWGIFFSFIDNDNNEIWLYFTDTSISKQHIYLNYNVIMREQGRFLVIRLIIKPLKLFLLPFHYFVKSNKPLFRALIYLVFIYFDLI